MATSIHNGKKQYAGAEAANMSLGQGGWIWTAGVAADQFRAEAGTDADPVWYYPDVRYWSGVKVFPTTDADGNATLVTLDLTPLDTNNIDESKADTPGSTIRVQLQSGQQLLGAFSRIRIQSNVEGTLIIFKG